MQQLIQEKVNVLAVFRSFRDKGEQGHGGKVHKRIEPYRIKRNNGDVYKVAEIRKSYAARKGPNLHIHYIIKTTEGRYFDLVFDSGELNWIILYEFDGFYLNPG